jgi:hypothetical protein
MSTSKSKSHWSDNYPWYEHHRCCDQQYARDRDEWSPEELDELRSELLETDGGPIYWDVPLWLHGTEAGCMRIDLRRVLDPSHRSRRRLSDPEWEHR